MPRSATEQMIPPAATTVGAVVAEDFRTADVFAKHGIDFCCGGRIALAEICREKGLDLAMLQQELAASGATARSLTDPDSRPMLSGRRIEVCYNVQTAVDAKHKLIVAEDVTNAAGDRDQLSPMAAAAQDALGGATPVVVADQGYYHGAEITTCVAAGFTPLVPRPLTSANEARGLFTKDDFVYEAEVDAYRCPACERLTYRTTTVELGRTIKNYRTSACGRCMLKPRCTRNRDGRKLTRWVHEDVLEEMAPRLRRTPELFAQRKALSEHPFGTMKRAMDQGYFLLKGLRQVRGEFSLTVLAYNLKRVLNLVGVPQLLDALA